MYKNEVEFQDFLYWYSRLDIKYKIYVAGNHDITVEKNLFNVKQQMEDQGIIYLENSDVTIEGVKIWGSPHTPTFGNWSFMKARSKLDKVWKNIPDDVDVAVVHGPPKGIMDLSFSREGNVEMCGCNALKKRILQIEPILFLSGHIHNNKDIINAGTSKLSNYKTIFSNGSVVTDGKFGKLSSNGNVLEIN
jgi:Icc-related predicted phosphoesterase